MKEQFTEPSAEIVKFSRQDIVTASAFIDEDDSSNQSGFYTPTVGGDAWES